MNSYLILILSVCFGAGQYLFVQSEQLSRAFWAAVALILLALFCVLALCWQGLESEPEVTLLDGVLGGCWLVSAAGTLYCGFHCLHANETKTNLLWFARLIGCFAALLLFLQSWLLGLVLVVVSLLLQCVLLPRTLQLTEQHRQEDRTADWHELLLAILAGMVFCYCGLAALQLTLLQDAENVSGQQLPRASLIAAVREQAEAAQPESLSLRTGLQPPIGIRLSGLIGLVVTMLLACYWIGRATIQNSSMRQDPDVSPM